jgi:chloramphenicol-sensitive protein RarD
VAPLVLFASAAIRMPLTTLGFFQYLAPSLSLLLAVFYFEEAVSSARWVSFSLVWFGLVIFSVEGLYVYQQHRARQLPRN